MTYKHHIIPRHEWKKRFGNFEGFNSHDNIVFLTNEQHIEVHKRYWEDRQLLGDLRAWKLMEGKNEELCKIQGSIVGRMCRGKKLSKEDREKKSLSARGFLPQQHRLKLAKSRKGVARTPEVIEKIKHTLKKRKELSIIKKPRSIHKVFCPYCLKYGAQYNMTRYHFKNCK